MEFTQSKFSRVARSCAIKVAIAAAAVFASIFIIGLVIENFDAIASVCTAVASTVWSVLLFVTSLGGYFWGAVAVDVAAVSVFAWSCCVWGNLDVPFEKSPEKKRLLIACILACGVALLCAINVGTTMSAAGPHSTYQGVACAFVILPLGLGAFFCVLYGMVAFATAVAESS